MSATAKLIGTGDWQLAASSGDAYMTTSSPRPVWALTEGGVPTGTDGHPFRELGPQLYEKDMSVPDGHELYFRIETDDEMEVTTV